MDLIEKGIKETQIEIKTAICAIIEAEKDLILENYESLAPNPRSTRPPSGRENLRSKAFNGAVSSSIKIRSGAA